MRLLKIPLIKLLPIQIVLTSQDVTHIPTFIYIATDPTPSMSPICLHGNGIYDLLHIQQHLLHQYLKTEVVCEISPMLTLLLVFMRL